MSELIDMAMQEGSSAMSDAIDHLKAELLKVRTGKASTGIVKDLLVDYYGNPTPLSQVANLGTPDSKTISIQAWEKSLMPIIEQAIFAANLGLTPMNDGEFIRISIPPMTEERRIEMVKRAKSLGEEAKVSLRNSRQKIMQTIKDEVKDGFPEDAGKHSEAKVETIVKGFVDNIGKLVDAKEIDIMKV